MNNPDRQLSGKRYAKYLLLGLLGLFMLLYACRAIYRYNTMGLSSITVESHLMLYLYLFAVVVIPAFFLRSPGLQKVCLCLGAVVVSLFMAELYFSIAGTQVTMMEQATGHYVSFYNGAGESYYHVWTADTPHFIQKPEYRYIRQTNSLGLPDVEWNRKKDTRRRLLALGDSFTEGDGAPQDSCYVSLLSDMLNKDSATWELMNAGVCGSDPFFNYINYKERLAVYKPDIIIQSLSAGDVLTDMATKGGLNRFSNDQKLTPLKSPWWEPVFAISYVSRAFFYALGYNQQLVKQTLTKQMKNDYDAELIRLFEAYDSIALENNARLYIVIRPDNKYEVMDSQPYYDFASVIGALRQHPNIQIVELLPMYKEYFRAREKSNIDDYYWPVDGHPNSRGYGLMASITYNAVFARPDFSVEKK